MTISRRAATIALLALVAACGSDDGDTGVVIDPGDGGRYAPAIDPADFVEQVDNPFFPLHPGDRWEYEGESEGEAETDVVEVLDERRTVMGISAVVVHDVVSVEGEVAEETFDWYAQDRDGNVWYLGEDSREMEDGEVVSTEGSWEAGVDGALPGIIMPADPEVGFAYRQEFDEGNAEDLAEVTEVSADRLVIKEWNPLEPEVIEEKTYERGTGVVAERSTRGPAERLDLVRFTPAS